MNKEEDNVIQRVIHGDCLEVMKDIDDKSIDMILCDLPYGTTACKWDVVIPFEPLWKQYGRIIKNNAAIVLTASQPFTSALVMSNIKMFKTNWVWNKEISGNFIQAKNHPLRTTEDIIVFGNKKINYFPILEYAKKENIRPQNRKEQKTDFLGKVSKGEFIPKSDKNKRFPKNLITFNGRKKECNNVNRLHPTQKPVALFEYLIKTYTNEGDLVLDNCAGSGTTGVACINTNRQFILIEKDPRYYEMARKRIEATSERLI